MISPSSSGNDGRWRQQKSGRNGTFEVVASREPEQTPSLTQRFPTVGIVNVGAKAGQVLKAV